MLSQLRKKQRKWQKIQIDTWHLFWSSVNFIVKGAKISLHIVFPPDKINKFYLTFSSCDSFDSRECQKWQKIQTDTCHMCSSSVNFTVRRAKISLHFGFPPDKINKLYLTFSSCGSFHSRGCERTAANKADPRVSKLLVNYKFQPSTLKQTSKITDKESENSTPWWASLWRSGDRTKRAVNSNDFNHFLLSFERNRKRQLVAKMSISYFCLANKYFPYFTPIV